MLRLHAVLGSLTVGLWAAYVHRVTKSLAAAGVTAFFFAVSPVVRTG